MARRRDGRGAASGLPSRADILAFIEASEEPVDRRAIAKHFRLDAADKVALKLLLTDMTDEGIVDLAPGRAFHRAGGVPRVTVFRVVAPEGSGVVAVPDRWEAPAPPPRLRVIERGRRGALGVGDRFLGRTEEQGRGLAVHVMKRLAAASESIIGVVVAETGPEGRVRLLGRPADKRLRYDVPLSDAAGAEAGELVRIALSGRGGATRGEVVERLGDPFAPRALSLIAIEKFGLRTRFGEAALTEADRVADLALGSVEREDLRHLPIVAIDPADARDHDDALWAEPDADVPGGHRAIVAIADVAFYVRAGSALDEDARRRGNSVYFPDRVVPMLPERLSGGICSLKQDENRAALVCHLTIAPNGKVTAHRFARALIRVAANIPYEQAQAAIDGAPSTVSGELRDAALRPLWSAWRSLAAARAEREPLDLDLPERRVVLDEGGAIREVAVRERLDAHRLVEDFMIAANVAAAQALEARKRPVMYRVHEPPSREKLVALKDHLETFDLTLALGQVIRPATFNRFLKGVEDAALRPQLMEAVLRSQTQAYYGPTNAGHFGLALGQYAHFTSPIRRYADLLVHRSLVDAFGLDAGGDARTGLSEADRASLARVGEAISALERTAMEAERETVDRYVAAWLSSRVGEAMAVRITGIQPFGVFVTVDGVGGDGFVPLGALGDDRYDHDDAGRRLIGQRDDATFAMGDIVEMTLIEANPISGALRFVGEGGASDGRGPVRDRRPTRGPTTARRGRPANIRHQGRRR